MQSKCDKGVAHPGNADWHKGLRMTAEFPRIACALVALSGRPENGRCGQIARGLLGLTG